VRRSRIFWQQDAVAVALETPTEAAYVKCVALGPHWGRIGAALGFGMGAF